MFTENFKNWIFSIYEKLPHRHKWILVTEYVEGEEIYKWWECKICGKIMSYGFSKPRWKK